MAQREQKRARHLLLRQRKNHRADHRRWAPIARTLASQWFCTEHIRNGGIRQAKNKKQTDTSRYKAQYLELRKTNPSAVYKLGTRLAGIFDYLGYKGTEKVKGWETSK